MLLLEALQRLKEVLPRFGRIGNEVFGLDDLDVLERRGSRNRVTRER